MDVCRVQAPPQVTVSPGHVAACWLHVEPAQRQLSQNGIVDHIHRDRPGEARAATGPQVNKEEKS
jgi:hypothetical protein